MLDHSTGRSRGFGFVTFESEETVEKIISEGKMHDLGGKQVSFLLSCCTIVSTNLDGCFVSVDVFFVKMVIEV